MQLPRSFGPYTLLKRLAVGGMAEIYVAKTRGLGGFEKLVALKLVHPHLSADAHFVQMLIDEAKILVLLTHANVAQVFDLGCIEGSYFMSMEYVEGLDLHGLQKAAARAAQELPIPVCCYIVAEMLNGLDYAHRRRDASGRPLNIVHRDVSPQNVLISHAGEVKLVDFGIAKTAMRGEGTEVGVVKGKYYYMSPEQAWADPIDRRSDVFSTGIVLYEMLTGRMLYSARSIPELIGKVRAAQIPSPITLREEIPEKLASIVMKALDRDMNTRYQSALDFGEALRDFLYETSPSFNAARLSQYVASLLEIADRVAGPTTPPKADETGQLRALSREEVRTENSVLFAIQNAATQTDAGRVGRVRGKGTSMPPPNPQLTPPPAAPPRISGWPLDDTEVGEAPTERSPFLPSMRPSGAPSMPAAPPPARSGALPPPASVPRIPSLRASAGPVAPRFPQIPKPPGVPSVSDTPPPARTEEAEPTGQYRPRHAGAMGARQGSLAPPPPLIGSFPPPIQSQPAISPAFVQAPAAGLPPLSGTHALVPPPGGDLPSLGPIPPSPPVPDFSSGPGAQRGLSRRALQVGLGAAVALCCLLAFRLASGSQRPPQLEVISVPQGAHVRVDGAQQTGVTPLRITGLEVGRKYALRVELAGYVPWEASYQATPGAVQHIAVLQPITGELYVTSSPAGATVFLDGVAIGKTPLTVSSLAVGRRLKLRVQHSGYAEVSREVLIQENALKSVERFTLTQPLHPHR